VADMGKRKRNKGIIKQILQEHFAGFWKLHADLLPKNLQNDIKETVEKSIRCGTRDMGFAKYNVWVVLRTLIRFW
jgi:hypothetical protein